MVIDGLLADMVRRFNALGPEGQRTVLRALDLETIAKITGAASAEAKFRDDDSDTGAA